MSKRRTQHRAGFSLVELMIAVVVMGIVTSQLLLAFSHQHTSSVAHERVIEIQQEVRLVSDIILSDLRVGGLMVPSFAAIASTDGGPNASDVLCVSDSTIIDENVLDAANEKFQGAIITGVVIAGDTDVIVSAGTMDIDSDGDNDFAVNGGVLIGTGTSGHCAVVTGLTASTISFAPATPAGFTAVADDVAVPALVYQVVGTTLSRNSIVLSNHIEDLQVQFGVDADRDGTVQGAEFPIDDLTGQEFELIENARVTITARDLRGTIGFNGQFSAVANRVAGVADTFKRRRVVADTLIRNMH